MNVWLSAFFIVALILAEWRPGRTQRSNVLPRRAADQQGFTSLI